MRTLSFKRERFLLFPHLASLTHSLKPVIRMPIVFRSVLGTTTSPSLQTSLSLSQSNEEEDDL